MRFSHQRERIKELVQSTYTHPTAEWVYETLKPEIPGLSLGTVYCNLRNLAEQGVIGRCDLILKAIPSSIRYAVAAGNGLFLALIPLTYSITQGIVWGFLSYFITKLPRGKFRDIRTALYLVDVFAILTLVAPVIKF